MSTSVENLEMLKMHTKRCCCKYCGNALVLKRILFSQCEDAQIEPYCPQCQRIEYGVEPEIYSVAEYLVKALDFNAFPQLDENENTRAMNIAKICEILYWGNHLLGFIDETGFSYPVQLKQEEMGSITVLEDTELDEMP